MLENIQKSKYSDAVDSYTALNVSSKIKGTLIEKEDKNIKIDIGNNQALDIELREDVSIKKGETVLIDRRNIVKSKVIDLKENIKIEKNDMDIYSSKLNELDIDVSEKNIKAIKKLDSFGIDITKDNVETYLIAKNSLSEISTLLDYDNTIKLIEMDVDIENESIQKLASMIEGLEEEQEGFNILKMFKKKDITTEEAEGIAKKLYGSKMGKDIIDIIKSLHKKKVNITKKNIEKINDVFYKLDNLKDIEDKTFINTIKNKLDINIENLYKVKRYVKDEKIDISTDKNIEMHKFNNKRIINIKGYEHPKQNRAKITSRELEFLQEDIEDLMTELELEPSEDNIKLSKEFIKRNMDVTKENIVGIGEMKEALKTVIQKLDKEITAQLIKENIDIESTDIRIIAEKINLIKNPDRILERVNSQDLSVREIKELKQEVLKVMKEIENKVAEVEVDEKTELQVKKELSVQEIKVLKQEVMKVIEEIETKVADIGIDEKIESQVKKELPTQEIKELKQEVTKVMEKIENKVSDIEIAEKIEPQVKKESSMQEIKELKQEAIKVIEEIENKVADIEIDEKIESQVKKESSVKEIKVLKQEVLKAIEEIESKVAEVEVDEKTEPQVKKESSVQEIKELKQEVLKVMEEIENKVSDVKTDEKIEPQTKKESSMQEIKELKQEVLKIIEEVENKVEDIEIDGKIVPQAKKESSIQEIKELNQEVTKVIEEIENKVLEIEVDEKIVPQARKESYMQEIKELKQEVLKIMEKIENKVLDIDLNKAIETIEQESIEKIMNKIDTLKKVGEKDILSLLEKDVDFKINKIEQVIFGKREPVKIERFEGATYARPIEQATVDSIDTISKAFKEIGKLDFNTVALQIKRNIPMTISNMQKSSAFLDAINNKSQLNKEKEYEGNETTSVIKALNRNNLDSNKFNIQKAMEVYKSYNNIRDNLTSNMVRNAVENNIKLENMDVSLTSKYLDNYTKSSVDYESIKRSEKEKYAHEFTESISDMMENIDENVMFLIKNKKSISFKELREIQSIFQNENQLGHKISEIDELVNEKGTYETKQKFEKLKKDIGNISKGMSESQEELEKAYKQVEKSIDEIEDNLKFVDQYHNDVASKKSKEISVKIDENKIIAKENGIIQIPLYINGQFTNLNMYFRDKQREKSKNSSEDISVVLSIDTVNMGNININLDIEKKNVNMKIGLKNINDRSHMEDHKNLLVDFLEQDGYSIGKVSFHSEEEIDLLGLEESSQTKKSISDSNLDLKI